MNNLAIIKRSLSKCLLFFLALSIGSCEVDNGITVNRVGEVPPFVTNVQVEPIAGGAVIRYDLPESEDLRYIKATYVLDNGTVRESKASIYDNNITVDGFGMEGVYEVALRSVAVGEVESEPLNISIEALRPPYLQVWDDLQANNEAIEVAFGGINVDYVNPAESNIIIRVIARDSIGEWNIAHAEYTNLQNGRIRLRGQESRPTEYGIYVEDRWDHRSDTIYTNLTPILEQEIPKNLFTAISINDGVTEDVTFNTGNPLSRAWDGNINNNFILPGNPSQFFPLHFTIDLGQPAIISRLHMWPRTSIISSIYAGTHIYDFEIYGSNTPTETWTLLGTFLSERPSGLGVGVAGTQDELSNLIANGEEYEFPDPLAFEKFRYIRFKVNANWTQAYSGASNLTMAELFLYGQL